MVDFTLSLEKGMRELSSTGAFLTVKGEGKVNTMTISWGFVGFMWNRPVFITVVRPQRYTKEIFDNNADSFTISVPFDGKLKEALKVCGTESGRDIDKSKIVEFTPAKLVSSPTVAGCDLYYECKLHTSQPLDGALLPADIVSKFYEDDFHYLYWGEIVECYEAG